MAEKLITNGRIWTSDKSMPWATDILIEDDRIIEVKNGIINPSEDCEVINAEGKMIVPSFIDSHIHAVMAAKTLWCLLLEPLEYESVEQILGIVKDYCDEHPKEEVPYIYAYSCPAPLMDGEHINKHLVDEFVADRPVLLCDDSFHRCLVNSMMLELMEVTKDTPYDSSAAGNYERFDDGEPNGIITERLHEFNHDLDKMFENLGWWPPQEDNPEVIEPVLDMMTEFGISCIHEGFADSEKSLVGFKALENQGKLKQYIHTMPNLDVNTDDLRNSFEEGIATAKRWADEYNSKYITIDSVKLFLDGTNEIGTSAVLEPFINNSEDCGRINVEEDDLTYLLERLNQEKLSIQIHLVGDRAFKVALNAFERAIDSENKKGRDFVIRVTLLHCELTKPEDRLRTVHPNLYINTSPMFNAGIFGDEAKLYLGEERFNSMFAFNDMIKYGATVNCSSDIVDEESLPECNPLRVIEAGVRRTLTDDEHIRPMESEKISLEDMLMGYTINNAKGVGRADSIGSLEVGKIANLCILSENLFETPVDRIKNVKVEKNMFEGVFI